MNNDLSKEEKEHWSLLDVGHLKKREFGIEIVKSYDEYNLVFNENKDFTFMNHGYYPVHPKCADILLDTSASMYCHLVDKFGEVKGKSILDIGCGRGGGTKILKKLYDFSEVFGCDLNVANINNCKLEPMGCFFKLDDAQYLGKFKSGYFDFIINVESSHCYPDHNKFFNSVKRVLKRDGLFITADIIDPARCSHYFHCIHQHFKVIEIEDITSNVEKSCEHLLKKFLNSQLEEEVLIKEIAEKKLNLYSKRKTLFFTSLLAKK